MPSWGLASAQKLGVKYDSSSRKLIIAAEGYAGSYSSGMKFDRIPVPGELLFQLGDWQMVGGSKVPYRHNQAFAIDLPNRSFPSNQVTIETLSGFQTLQISNLPLVPTEAEAGSLTIAPTSPKSCHTKKEAKLVKPPAQLEDLIVVHKKPFQITASTITKSHPSAILDMFVKFDPNFFDLQTTTAQYMPTTKSTNLTYTFSSIQSGTSQILVHRLLQTLIPHLSTTTYNIDIDLPRHPTFIPSSKLRKLSNPLLPPKPKTFLERVLIGYELVRERLPKARLLEIDACGVKNGREVDSPMGFVVLRLVCSPGEGGDRTVVVQSTGWDDWGDVMVDEWVGWDLLPILGPEDFERMKMDAAEREGFWEMQGHKEEHGCDACGGCGGGHSPDCLSGLKVKEGVEGEDGGSQVEKFHPFSKSRGRQYERTQTTSGNFTPINQPQPKSKSKTPPFLDLEAAFNILTKAVSSSSKPKIISCNLRHPMYPGFSEPYYVFTLQKAVMGSLYIGIGAVGGGVRVFGGGQGGAIRRLSDAGEGTLGFSWKERERGEVDVV